MTRELSIWTIGHSTRSIAEFIEALKSFDIQLLIDVRSFPGSRRYPHFNKDALRNSLADDAVEYLHLPELGGRRRALKDSQNVAWRNEAFRGYADYMETDDFEKGINRLLETSRRQRTAIMCSEAVWWRCHRGLIADFLKAGGERVLHIMSRGKVDEHPFTGGFVFLRYRISQPR